MSAPRWTGFLEDIERNGIAAAAAEAGARPVPDLRGHSSALVPDRLS